MDMRAIDIDGDVTPIEAWTRLKSSPHTEMVDVRTHAEWCFVGVPDLSLLGKQLISGEWRRYPSMTANETFCEDLEAGLKDLPQLPRTLLFICRSGARSREAASMFKTFMRERGVEIACVNVAEGFEGDLDLNGRRGSANGWKANNLPWRQS